MEIDLTNGEAANGAGAGAAPIALPVLQLISEARNEHGMRQQDYTRYRHYCSSKTHRLRETLNLTHSDGSQKAAAAQKLNKAKGARGKKPKKAQLAADQSAAAKGTGNVFTQKTLKVEDVHNERPALLLLFEAERAWAHSQDLRTQAFDNDSDPALRKRGISRLRRAVQWSSSLNDLLAALSARFDVFARSEAAAYAVMLRGVAAFDRSQWQTALQILSVARLLLSAIAQNSKTSRSEALANSFVDAGEAQMRYCAYQLGESDQNMDAVARRTATDEVCTAVYPNYANLVDELQSEAAKAGAAKAEPLSITWHGHQIPIRNPELLDSIARAQAEEAALHEAIKDGFLQDENRAANKRATKGKTEATKRARLTHAQRNARKREAAASRAAPAGVETGPSPSSGATATQAGSTSRIGRAGRTELDPFDRALSALTDAEEVARRLVEDNAEALSKSHSARYETASKDLQTAHDYVFYRLLALHIARNSRLVADVERKAERREKRALANVEARIAEQQRTGRVTFGGGSSTSKKVKAQRQEARAQRPPRKNQPGARPKARPRKPKVHRRRPARIGMRKLRSRQAAARVARARAVASAKAKRRRARAVPSLAKLLDGAEISLTAMGSIALVESEPDVSSLVEAKAAWYRSELLRHLAGAFALSNAKAEALLLVTRAQLYVRQARQAADLAEEVEEEDRDFPPAIGEVRGGESVFDASDRRLEALKRAVQREIYMGGRSGRALEQGKGRGRAGKSGGSQMRNTKAGQTLLEMASKYVDFDPVDLDEARKVPQAVVDECERELGEKRRGSVVAGGGVESKVATSATSATSARAKAKVHVKTPAAVAGGAASKVDSAAEPAGSTAGAVPAVQTTGDAADEQEAFVEGEEGEEGEEGGDVSTAYDPGNALAEEEEERLATEAASKKKGWLGGWFGRG